ncbi:MAG: MBL fold metallo-hydrolase [Opitutaceae bacterium]|nr:MBL fold metallo-hydrolase [Opitutaceae bacterium]
MKLFSINTGHLKFDGGAMFGAVPKTIWQKLNPADENNMCSWAMRSLLIEEEDRRMLIDTGIGNKQSEKFLGHFYIHGDDTTERSLARHGFTTEDITDVFLTHLHHDHCGGCFVYDESKEEVVPAFPNATYWSNEKHWNWATGPNPREGASFRKDNIMPIQESGKLKFLTEGEPLIPGVDVLWVNGHTEAQMLPEVITDGKKVAYMGDLIPSIGHISLPYVMAYDVRPLVTMEEKAEFLPRAVEEEIYLFMQHDPIHELCTVKQTDRGVRLNEILKFEDVFGN